MFEKVKTVTTSLVTWLTLFSVAIGALAGGLAAAGWDDTPVGQYVLLAATAVGVALTVAVAVMRHLAQVPTEVVGLTTDKHQAWLNDAEAAALGLHRSQTSTEDTPPSARSHT